MSNTYLPLVLDELAASASQTGDADTFLTAHSAPATAATEGFLSPPPRSDVGFPLTDTQTNEHSAASSSSAVPLLETHNSSSGHSLRRPNLKMPHTDGNIGLKDKGKARVVHYADFPQAINSPAAMSDTPASPSEVLERSGQGVEDTSAGAMVDNGAFQDAYGWDDVIMRGEYYTQPPRSIL
jgi:hypothetical protein